MCDVSCNTISCKIIFVMSVWSEQGLRDSSLVFCSSWCHDQQVIIAMIAASQSVMTAWPWNSLDRFSLVNIATGVTLFCNAISCNISMSRLSLKHGLRDSLVLVFCSAWWCHDLLQVIIGANQSVMTVWPDVFWKYFSLVNIVSGVTYLHIL